MPVLMNKGADPRRAAWLFFTDKRTLEELLDSATEGRFEQGTLWVDVDVIESAKKASSEVDVYLCVKTILPHDVDLEVVRAQEVEQTKRALEDVPADTTAEVSAATTVGALVEVPAEVPADTATVYESLLAPEGLRVRIGSTTRLAAQNYFAHQDTLDSSAELPRLQMLCQLIMLMRDSEKGLPAHVVWYMDAAGIMRMAPAQEVKPMAGNVLRVKL